MSVLAVENSLFKGLPKKRTESQKHPQNPTEKSKRGEKLTFGQVFFFFGKPAAEAGLFRDPEWVFK